MRKIIIKNIPDGLNKELAGHLCGELVDYGAKEHGFEYTIGDEGPLKKRYELISHNGVDFSRSLAVNLDSFGGLIIGKKSKEKITSHIDYSENNKITIRTILNKRKLECFVKECVEEFYKLHKKLS